MSCDQNSSDAESEDFFSGKQFFRCPEVVAAEIDGAVLLMSVENGEYYGIRGVGGFIWGLLGVPVTLGQLISAIRAEFDIDEVSCQADLEGFLRELVDRGVVRTQG